MPRFFVFFTAVFMTFLAGLSAFELDLGPIEVRLGRPERPGLAAQICYAIARHKPILLTVAEGGGREENYTHVILDPYAVGRDRQDRTVVVGKRNSDLEAEMKYQGPAEKGAKVLGKIGSFLGGNDLEKYAFYNVIGMEILQEQTFEVDLEMVYEIDKKLVDWDCRIN